MFKLKECWKHSEGYVQSSADRRELLSSWFPSVPETYFDPVLSDVVNVPELFWDER